VIADLTFGHPDARGARRARFVPRTSIPLSAACLVANALRETLRELFGERCEVTLGEPVALSPDAWHTLSRNAHCFLTSGRQTDIVLVLPERDARALVLRAFGEGEGEGAGAGAPALSALELQAVERIAARCSPAFDPLCAERRGTSRRVAADAIPPCVAYFDVRIRQPIALEIGIGIVRNLPDPGPAGSFPAALLAHVPVNVRAQLGSGTIDFATLVGLAPGDVVRLQTQVGASATLNVGDRTLASGTAGVSGGRYCFEVQTVQRSMEGHA
jgi:flagellar motor switch/type III secretory pathway protein FliN